MPIDFELHPGFDAGKYAEELERHGLTTQRVKVSNVDMTVVSQGAPIICGDGRFARRKADRDHENAPKLMGASNFVAALKTGGTTEGFDLAARDVISAGFRPGFHKDCAMHRLWLQGQLGGAVYELVPPNYDPGEWVRSHAEAWGGIHFKDIGGVHAEEVLMINPIVGMTTTVDESRFGHDQWLAVSLGIDPYRSLGTVAEIIKKVSLCRRVRIVVP